MLMLGLFSQGKREIAFSENEEKLKQLLQEFGSHVRRPRAEYPFWRLQNDGIWSIFPNDLVPNSSGDVYASVLRQVQAKGQFSEEVQNWLLADSGRLTDATQQVLNAYFPASLHQELLTAVGFVDPAKNSAERKRDVAFRIEVLRAYRFRCSICAQDIRIGTIPVALEAAHIKWHHAGGPDIVSNGLSLCSIHHKLFDYGAFTITGSMRLLVSEHVTGSDKLDELLLHHHDREIARPNHQEQFPDHEYLEWHRQTIFKERPLPLEKSIFPKT